MFKPVALYIGLRYTRAKRRNHFISFISLASVLGIALGVGALITVLSVMNGFDYQIRHKIFAMARQVTVTDVQGGIRNWGALQAKINQHPDVLASAPYVEGQGMLVHAGMVKPVLVTGVLPNQQKKVSQIEGKVVSGSFKRLKAGEYGMVIGQTLAAELGVNVGDKVKLMTAQTRVTPVGIIPRARRFTVVGIFEVGGGFGYDAGVVFVQQADAQRLFEMGNRVSAIRLRIKDLYQSGKVVNQLLQQLPSEYNVSDWTLQYGQFFKAIAMEKTIMTVILVLIIVVAAFNLVATLVMVVADKRAEIAILRTLGATPRTILATFMVQGSLVGILGTVLGVLLGITLALNVTWLVNQIQRLFHVQFVTSSVYFVDYLPSRLQLTDVMHISFIALLLSLLATIYPAWQASRTQPAEALRYE